MLLDLDAARLARAHACWFWRMLDRASSTRARASFLRAASVFEQRADDMEFSSN